MKKQRPTIKLDQEYIDWLKTQCKKGETYQEFLYKLSGLEKVKDKNNKKEV